MVKVEVAKPPKETFHELLSKIAEHGVVYNVSSVRPNTIVFSVSDETQAVLFKLLWETFKAE